MRIAFTRRATKDLAALPPRMADRLGKQLGLLAANLRHPSIDAEKCGGLEDVWQGRVNRDFRFYFRIEDDAFLILRIIPHPK